MRLCQELMVWTHYMFKSLHLLLSSQSFLMLLRDHSDPELSSKKRFWEKKESLAKNQGVRLIPLLLTQPLHRVFLHGAFDSEPFHNWSFSLLKTRVLPAVCRPRGLALSLLSPTHHLILAPSLTALHYTGLPARPSASHLPTAGPVHLLIPHLHFLWEGDVSSSDRSSGRTTSERVTPPCNISRLSLLIFSHGI